MKQTISTTKESEKDCAQTPPWLYESIQEFLGVLFVLDVCANGATAKTGYYYSLEERGEDSLKLPWSDTNFCNPPFSDIIPWIEKAKQEALLGNSTAMIFPDNTETRYSRLAYDYADTVVHMPFRVNFLKPDGVPFLDKKGNKQGPQFPCVLVWFTPLGLKTTTRTMYFDFRT
jgi:phage N-6-adenine-methyltransferase